MSEKTKNIILWVLTGLVGAVFTLSAFGKLMGGEESVKMAANFGLTASGLSIIGIVELLSVILFIYPRTGVLGTLLLAAYMGGAIATHLEHGLGLAPVVVIEAFVWIVAVLRFPELLNRILGKA